MSVRAAAADVECPRGVEQMENDVLNRFSSAGDGEAKVQYLDGDFRVISPGAYVRCAVSGVRIPLEELKYWSVDRQEAYASPEAVLERNFPQGTQHDAR